MTAEVLLGDEHVHRVVEQLHDDEFRMGTRVHDEPELNSFARCRCPRTIARDSLEMSSSLCG